MAGFWGSFFSTLGIVVPSFTIIFVISLFFDRFLKFTVVANAFRGIQACVVYLILSAGVKMFKTLKKDAFGISVLIATLTAMILFSLFAVRFSTIFYILISGFLGWLLFFLHNRKEAHK